MLAEPHCLTHEFPDKTDTINSLLETDKVFAELAGRYHDLDNEIRDIETLGGNTSDDYLKSLKVERSALKDKIYSDYLS